MNEIVEYIYIKGVLYLLCEIKDDSSVWPYQTDILYAWL